MLDLLSGFVTELRKAGLPVSLTEHLDAAEAVRHIPLEDREGLKYALAATLVKSSSHWRAFETAFEVFFAVRTGGPSAAGQDGELGEADTEAEQAAGSGEGGPRGRGRSWKARWTGPNEGAVRVAKMAGWALTESGMPLPPERPARTRCLASWRWTSAQAGQRLLRRFSQAL